MSDTAIRAEALSKRYPIGVRQEGYKTVRETLTEAAMAPARRISSLLRRKPAGDSSQSIWALKNVSFDIKRGEVVGIIGRNGAGKSTLLKIMSRITEPTQGLAMIQGRVGSLLEVGTGFHPELTGRENIYLNGAILGMKRAEINRKFDEIVGFAEVERFVDTPVKRYSSGMHMRMAFAVAAHLEPEIMLVDEVLAVGDTAFQKRCLGKMGLVALEGRTVLFVSHNMAAISALCTSAMLIESGEIRAAGQPQAVIREYLAGVGSNADTSLRLREDRVGDGRLKFSSFVLRAADGVEVPVVQTGQDVTFELEVEVSDGTVVTEVAVQISFSDSIGQRLFTLITRVAGENFAEIRKGDRIRCHVPSFPLLPGTYTLDLTAKESFGGRPIDNIQDAVKLEVVMGDIFGTGRLPNPDRGWFAIPHTWSLVRSEDALMPSWANGTH